MQKRKGRPKIEYGTLPTPADPNPSNQTIKRYSDGTYNVLTPPPTPKVIAEYEQAIADWPDDAGLRMYFAFVLSMGGDKQAAMQQAREAIRLRPEWDWPHSLLAGCLCETGSLDEAVAESREALRLRLQKAGKTNEQGEAVSRWELAEILLRKGETAEARQELEQALLLQRAAVGKQRGSPQMLKRLETKWAEWSATQNGSSV